MGKDPFQQFSGEIWRCMNEMLKFQGFLTFLREFFFLEFFRDFRKRGHAGINE